MNPLKCEQYFYLLLSGKEKLGHLREIKEAEKKTIIPPFLLLQRQPGHFQAGCWSLHTLCAHAMLRGRRTPLSSNYYPLLIVDIQPKLFCEENGWTTYEKINCFSRTSITGRDRFSCPQPTLFLRLLGCLWIADRTILGVRYMVWSVLSDSFIFSLLHQHRMPDCETKEQLNWPILLLWH